MPSFQQRIAVIVPGANYKHVEACMRERTNLDLLTGDAFYVLCKECEENAKGDPKKYAEVAQKMRLRDEDV